MLDESLAKRYAAALYASASAKKQQREQLKELRIIQKELSEHAQLNQCLVSPAVARPIKKKIIQAVFADKISVRAFNFLFVLIDKGREACLNDIIECFKRQFCEENGIVEVTVESASELDMQLCIFIETHLNKITGKKIKMQTVVRPELIGGLVVKYGGCLYDGSIKRHLGNIHSLMAPKRS